MSRSAPAPGSPPTVSVFDFLYYDARRVGSLLAQLTGDGVLQGLKRTDATAKIARLDNQMQGKVSLAVAGASGAQTDSTTDEAREGLERSYDPFWANARGLLDLLDAHDLIWRDLDSAPIGQPVLASGALVMLDLGFLREVWKRPVIKKLIITQAAAAQALAAGSRQQRRATEKKPAPPNEAEVALDLIDLLPHTVQGTLVLPDAEVFFTIQPDGLVTPPGDLMLKHGTHLGDAWHVLGLLDAVPGLPTDKQLQDMTIVGAGSQFAQIVTGLAQPVQQLMGRPLSAYAVTPLAIFREVARPSPSFPSPP